MTGAPGPVRPDRGSPLPLWAQVLADLQRRLASGEFDGAFPGELALVAQYEVSRHTVREALRRLRESGQVIAERGRAPRVAAQAIVQPLGSIYSLFASVEAMGRRQRSVVRALDLRRDADAAARLELDPDAELFHLERLRLADDEPLALDRVWLPAALGRPLLPADFTYTALYDELERRCGVRPDSGAEGIRAVVPNAEERRILGIPRSVAALAISRRALAGGRLVEWRQTLVRGDRFEMTAEFSARAGHRVSMTADAPGVRS